jgi:hypothetical protein
MNTDDYNGYTISIDYDTETENPLDWTTPTDRLGNVHFALKHNRYDLPFEIDADMDDYNSWTELANAVTAKGGELAGYNFKFVRWYEHSGIAVSLRDNEDGHDWDAGIAGVVFGKTTDDIEAAFDLWKKYVEGDVYMLTVDAPDGITIESIGGMFGYDETLEEGQRIADEHAKMSPADRARIYGRVTGDNANVIHGGK